MAASEMSETASAQAPFLPEEKDSEETDDSDVEVEESQESDSRGESEENTSSGTISSDQESSIILLATYLIFTHAILYIHK